MRKKIILFLLPLLFSAGPCLAGEAVVRTATGVVTATNTETTPNTIVVKSKTSKGKDLIIGASLDERTVIKDKVKKRSLKDIKAGDRVEIRYERNSKITARSINIR